MPGMPVYQDSPSNLKNQIYATDGSNVINIKADNTGRLTVSTDNAAPLDVSITETDDSIAVYGSDGTDNIILLTDSDGRLKVATDTSDPLEVAISETNDSIVVYGMDEASNHVPLLTSAQGALYVNYSHNFVNEIVVDAEPTANDYDFSSEQDISDLTSYSFFIHNTGATNSATFKVQLSPDNVTWLDDSNEMTLSPGAAGIITASRFLRYIRIGYKSTETDDSTTVTSIFQAQG